MTFQERFDIAQDVIHLTKGDSPAAAFETLARIASERRLLGGTGHIKGGFQCVCFTEAPLPQLADVFARTVTEGLRYMPFGVLLPKRWLFEHGGRPVIYQADDEYERLPETLRYRHVRYEPHAPSPIDFTWEREWRIRTDELHLDPMVGSLVVPGEEHIARLRERHSRQQQREFELNSLQVGSAQAEQLREPFIWSYYTLEPPSLPKFGLGSAFDAV